MENSKDRENGIGRGCDGTTNPLVTRAPDNTLKGIRNPIPRNPDNLLKVIRNLVPKGNQDTVEKRVNHTNLDRHKLV